MEWYTARRDTHCLWSVSKPLVGIQWSWGNFTKHLQATHRSHHTILHRCWISNWTQNNGFLIPFQYGKWDVYYGGRHPLLMKCFNSLLGYIRKMWAVTKSVCKPLMGLIMPFLLRFNLKLYTKYQIFLPYWYSEWDYVLQIKTYIACEVFQNLP